jgi:hypothetical protein
VDREQQSTRPGATRATPPKSRSKTESKAAKPKAAASRAKGAGGTTPATSAPDIMSRLPKSRPQRSSQRRRAPVGAAAKSTAPSTPKRPVSTGARRPAAARPATPARPPAGQSRSAPGLPRLAIDGATEAVKLPLKVSGRLTLRALDAVARGLRRR